MKRLNKTAAELAAAFELRGGTDITGFSLLGHALEVANHRRSGCASILTKSPSPAAPSAMPSSGSSPAARSITGLITVEQVRFDPAIAEHNQMLLFDAQTSGGLLLAVPSAKIAAFLAQAARVEQPAWLIGEAVAGAGIEVVS